MPKKKCINCRYVFNTTKKYPNDIYCSKCRKYHKNCEICGKEIFVQARTCSPKCAYELRKKKWKESCGTEHNFSKNSKSRKKWELNLLDKEGIINTAQRKNVKEKIKDTFRKKYNGIDNPFGVKEIHDQIRIDKEKAGLWIPLSKLSEFEKYRYNVDKITYINYFKFGEKYLKLDLKRKKEINKNVNFKNKLSLDHKFSIYEGFKNKISPEIIGSIVNMEIIKVFENSSKNKKCSISLNKLLNDYKNFLDENKEH